MYIHSFHTTHALLPINEKYHVYMYEIGVSKSNLPTILISLVIEERNGQRHQHQEEKKESSTLKIRIENEEEIEIRTDDRHTHTAD